MEASDMLKELAHRGVSLRATALEDLVPEFSTVDALFDQIIHWDIRDKCVAMLPERPAEVEDEVVEGPLMLQIMRCRDISLPRAAKHGKKRDDKRLLSLRVTDGTRHCGALELEQIKELSDATLPGTKILVEKVSLIHGALLLRPSNTKVLGGRVEALIESFETEKKALEMVSLQKRQGREGTESDGSAVKRETEDAGEQETAPRFAPFDERKHGTTSSARKSVERDFDGEKIRGKKGQTGKDEKGNVEDKFGDRRTEDRGRGKRGSKRSEDVKDGKKSVGRHGETDVRSQQRQQRKGRSESDSPVFVDSVSKRGDVSKSPKYSMVEGTEKEKKREEKGARKQWREKKSEPSSPVPTSPVVIEAPPQKAVPVHGDSKGRENEKKKAGRKEKEYVLETPSPSTAKKGSRWVPKGTVSAPDTPAQETASGRDAFTTSSSFEDEKPTRKRRDKTERRDTTPSDKHQKRDTSDVRGSGGSGSGTEKGKRKEEGSKWRAKHSSKVGQPVEPSSPVISEDIRQKKEIPPGHRGEEEESKDSSAERARATTGAGTGGRRGSEGVETVTTSIEHGLSISTKRDERERRDPKHGPRQSRLVHPVSPNGMIRSPPVPPPMSYVRPESPYRFPFMPPAAPVYRPEAAGYMYTQMPAVTYCECRVLAGDISPSSKSISLNIQERTDDKIYSVTLDPQLYVHFFHVSYDGFWDRARTGEGLAHLRSVLDSTIEQLVSQARVMLCLDAVEHHVKGIFPVRQAQGFVLSSSPM